MIRCMSLLSSLCVTNGPNRRTLQSSGQVLPFPNRDLLQLNKHGPHKPRKRGLQSIPNLRPWPHASRTIHNRSPAQKLLPQHQKGNHRLVVNKIFRALFQLIHSRHRKRCQIRNVSFNWPEHAVEHLDVFALALELTPPFRGVLHIFSSGEESFFPSIH